MKKSNHKINLVQAIKNIGGKQTARSQVITENTQGLVPVLVYDNFEKIKFSKIIKVPKSKISGNTNIEIDVCLFRKNEKRVGKLKRKSTFSRNKIFIQMTKVKPGLSAAWIGPDRIAISCEQNDPRGKSIEIFYKNHIAALWKSIASPGLAYQQGYTVEISLSSISLNADAILLRAISKNRQGKYGSFYDVVLPTSRDILNIQDYPVEESIFNSLSSYNLTSLDSGPGSITVGLTAAKAVFARTGKLPKLRRTEFAIAENNRRVMLGEKTKILSPEILTSLSYIKEVNVSEGNFYEYTILTGSVENEKLFSRSLIQYFPPPDWLAASVRQVKISRSVQQTSFRMSVSLMESKGSHFLTYLKKSGIYDTTGEEIKNIRQKLSQFFLFKLTQKNTITGETQTRSMPPGLFSISVVPSVPYAYTFELFAGNPNQIINNLSQDSNSSLPLPFLIGSNPQKVLQGMKNFKPSISAGNVSIDTTSSQDSVSQNLYDLINTGWKFSLTYPAPTPGVPSLEQAVISDINFYKFNPSGDNIVEWKVSGLSNTIDHFIIFSNANEGDISLAGAHHHKPNGPVYSFYDKRFRGAIGMLSYGVSIVFNDMNISPPAYSSIKRLSR